MQNFNLIKPEYLQYMAPMGRIKAVSNLKNPLVRGSNYLRQADLPGIQQFESEMANYTRRLAREAALAYQKRMKDEAMQRSMQAFGRATKGFSPQNLLNKFINK